MSNATSGIKKQGIQQLQSQLAASFDSYIMYYINFLGAIPRHLQKGTPYFKGWMFCVIMVLILQLYVTARLRPTI